MCLNLIKSTFQIVFLVALTTAFAEESPAPDLKVTIIVVHNFTKAGMRDRTLDASSYAAGLKLKKYFEDQFHVAPVFFSTAYETSGPQLRKWLLDDFGNDTRRIVHLVFIVTHGRPKGFPDPATANRTLLLAASDTTKENFSGTSILASDFLERARQIPAIVFLFIDACGGGAVDNANLTTDLADAAFGSRIFVVASSMEEQAAYRARFTTALYNLWSTASKAGSQRPCHRGEREIARFLTKQLKSVKGVSADAIQDVTVIAPFWPEFCIESFHYSQRMLVVFNGSTRDIKFYVLERNVVAPSDDDWNRIPPNKFLALNLEPKRFKLTATEIGNDAGQIGRTTAKTRSIADKAVNLDSEPAHVEVLFGKDDLAIADANAKILTFFESNQLFPQYTAELRDETKQRLSTALENLNSELTSDLEEERELEGEYKQGSAVLSQRQDALQDAREREYRAGSATQTCRTSHSCTSLGQMQAEQQSATSDVQYRESQVKEAEDHLNRLDHMRALLKQSEALTRKNQDLGNKQLEEFQVRENQRLKNASRLNKLQQRIARTFMHVENTYRGIEVKGIPSYLAGRKKQRFYSELVEAINSDPDIRVEIEVFERGSNSLEEQRKLRAIADHTLEDLKSLGMASRSAAARACVELNRKSTTPSTQTQIVLSLPTPPALR